VVREQRVPSDRRVPPAALDSEAALEFMQRRGISTQMLSLPLAFGTTPDEPGFAARFAREVNEAYAGLIKESPGRFGAFAAVPMDTPDHALAEIEYALDTLGLDGVLLTSNVQGRYFGEPSMSPSWPSSHVEKSRCSSTPRSARTSTSSGSPG